MDAMRVWWFCKFKTREQLSRLGKPQSDMACYTICPSPPRCASKSLLHFMMYSPISSACLIGGLMHDAHFCVTARGCLPGFQHDSKGSYHISEKSVVTSDNRKIDPIRLSCLLARDFFPKTISSILSWCCFTITIFSFRSFCSSAVHGIVETAIEAALQLLIKFVMAVRSLLSSLRTASSSVTWQHILSCCCNST